MKYLLFFGMLWAANVAVAQNPKADSIRQVLLMEQANDFYKVYDFKNAKASILRAMNIKTQHPIVLYKLNVKAGLYTRKLNEFDQALKFLTVAQNINERYRLNEISVYINLQRLYGDKGFTGKQLFYTLKCLDISRAKADTMEVALSSYDVADVYVTAKQTDKALSYYQEGLKIMY
jgi:tetratricopeptide (TPR) repeat protein